MEGVVTSLLSKCWFYIMILPYDRVIAGAKAEVLCSSKGFTEQWWFSSKTPGDTRTETLRATHRH